MLIKGGDVESDPSLFSRKFDREQLERRFLLRNSLNAGEWFQRWKNHFTGCDFAGLSQGGMINTGILRGQMIFGCELKTDWRVL
jgi:hypothetical protein